MTTKTPPQHGERACYLRGCQRTECLNAHYQYMSRLRLEYQRGQRRRTNATQVTEHVNKLMTAGWLQAQIARAAGINHRTISEVVHSGYATVSNETARRILAVPVGPPPNDAQDVDATGTIRRLQALVAIGHTYPEIASRVGIHRDALGVIIRGDRASVRVATAKVVASVYRQLSRTPGQSVRSRLQAERSGWHGPLAWDDIDDPAATPEASPAYQSPARYTRDPLRRGEIEHLYLLGESVPSIAKQLGGNERYISDRVDDIIRERQARAEQERLAARQRSTTGMEAAA